MQDKEDRLAMARILARLEKYSKAHLEVEEKCLNENGYPHYETHKQAHQFFLSKLEQFRKDFEADKFTLHFEVAIFLKNWVVNHIMNDDKEYKAFLNEKGVM